MESFGRDWDDWVAEIRDAAEVPGLTVDLPEAQPQPDRLEYVEEPMTLKADVKLIVCPGNLRRCMREQPAVRGRYGRLAGDEAHKESLGGDLTQELDMRGLK